MNWTKVITDPLGFAGFALALVFAVVGKVMAQKRTKSNRWIVPAFYALAAVCVVGGLTLAYRHELIGAPAKTQAMHIGKIEQKSDNGVAVAGVQGDVTVNKPATQKAPKPQH